MGSTKLLSLDIKKGSEDFKVEWFKKNKGSLKKVNIGNTFSVSPEENVTYYMATINDNINEPENIFFQVEADESAEPINEAAQAAAVATAETPQPETITAPSPPPQEQVKKEPQPIAQEEPAV